MYDELRLSPLGHTWIIDLDGTIVVHNGYLSSEGDRLLPGAKEFLASIPIHDMIIFLSSRKEEVRDSTIAFLTSNSIRFDHLILGAPYGERILMNDDKPSGLQVSIALNKKRDDNSFPRVIIDESL